MSVDKSKQILVLKMKLDDIDDERSAILKAIRITEKSTALKADDRKTCLNSLALVFRSLGVEEMRIRIKLRYLERVNK